MVASELRAKLLELLKSDEEFRLAVAGLIGLDTILYELKKLREDSNKRFEALERKLLEHDTRLGRVESRLDRIELELGALGESFYAKAFMDELKDELETRGEKLEFKERNARVDNEDIDLLIVTDKAVYVVEVKVKPKHGDVGELLAKADVVRKHYKDRKIVPVLAGAMIGKEIEEYAKQKNVQVYKV